MRRIADIPVDVLKKAGLSDADIEFILENTKLS
jgi:hypothetical protein